VLAQGAARTSANGEGYLTSVCHSPTLGRDVALAFVRDGQARTGETVRTICQLRGVETLAEIVPLPFVDPEGGRLRG
jgi:sarcosine oxidase subunit alpha